MEYIEEEINKIKLEIEKEMEKGKEITEDFGEYLMSRLEALNNLVKSINQEKTGKTEEKTKPWGLTPEQMRNIDPNTAKENAARAVESIQELPDNVIE